MPTPKIYVGRNHNSYTNTFYTFSHIALVILFLESRKPIKPSCLTFSYLENVFWLMMICLFGVINNLYDSPSIGGSSFIQRAQNPMNVCCDHQQHLFIFVKIEVITNWYNGLAFENKQEGDETMSWYKKIKQTSYHRLSFTICSFCLIRAFVKFFTRQKLLQR